MATRLIFICHGQLDHEREDGLRLVSVIDKMPGFRAYFAEAVHDTDGLSQHIFGNLERCDGFLAVMHKRGEVEFLGRRITRASVWVQQELAIVTFLNYQRQAERRSKVRVFAERGIEREGLANVLILNPIEFEHITDLTEKVTQWLKGPDFAPNPIATTREDLFRKITARFNETHWRYMEVMMVLSRNTTNEVDRSHVLTMLGHLGAQNTQISPAEDELRANGILHGGYIDRTRNIQPVCLTPGFIDLIADELQRQGAVLPSAP